MTDLQQDSFDTHAVGQQVESHKATFPAYSFGTGDRDTARLKVFMSSKVEKTKVVINSPGPVYNVPSSVGGGPMFGFGIGPARPRNDIPKYPDSSSDLACVTVDSQKVKFSGTPGCHFGTEERLSNKNAEIIRTNPSLGLGQESPGAEYDVKDGFAVKRMPNYSFGPEEGRSPRKEETRVALVQSSSPRHLGPGSHMLPGGLGAQPSSPRASAPAWSMALGGRSPRGGGPKLSGEPSVEDKPFSSIGKQVLSKLPTSPRGGFGKSTRDQVGRTAICITNLDRTSVANMPKPRFNMDLPVRPLLNKPGI